MKASMLGCLFNWLKLTSSQPCLADVGVRNCPSEFSFEAGSQIPDFHAAARLFNKLA